MAFWNDWFGKKKEAAAPVVSGEVDLAKRIPVETAEQKGIRAAQERLGRIGAELGDKSAVYNAQESKFRGEGVKAGAEIPLETMIRENELGVNPMTRINEELRNTTTAYNLKDSIAHGPLPEGKPVPAEEMLRSEIKHQGGFSGGGEAGKG